METATEKLARTLADLLKPPPTPEPGKERWQVRWFDPTLRKPMVERFAREDEARQRFHELRRLPPARRARLEVVERRGGGWERRSTLKEGRGRVVSRAGGMAAAQREAQLRRFRRT